jgi:hypothetical protein
MTMSEERRKTSSEEVQLPEELENFLRWQAAGRRMDLEDWLLFIIADYTRSSLDILGDKLNLVYDDKDGELEKLLEKLAPDHKKDGEKMVE